MLVFFSNPVVLAALRFPVMDTVSVWLGGDITLSGIWRFALSPVKIFIFSESLKGLPAVSVSIL